jgi:hypothetical protein
MSEEKNPDANTSDVSTETEQEKESNNTFTQSDFDKALAREISKIKTQYSDYDDLKSEFAELKKWKDQKEQENMSEQEKLAKLIQDQESEKNQLKGENENLLKRIMKQEVLFDKKYAHLPTVYRQAISGETREEVVESADNILIEYNNDLKSAGKPMDNVSVPPDVSAEQVQQTQLPKDINDKINLKISNRLKKM